MSIINLNVKNSALSNHFEEVEKEVSSLIQGDIERMVNSRMGADVKDVVKFSGDITKGLHISAVTGEMVDLEDLVGEKKIEDAVMDALEYNYTGALDRAIAIVQSMHPEDLL